MTSAAIDKLLQLIGIGLLIAILLGVGLAFLFKFMIEAGGGERTSQYEFTASIRRSMDDVRTGKVVSISEFSDEVSRFKQLH